MNGGNMRAKSIVKSIGKLEEISKRDVLALWNANEERFRAAGSEHYEMAESAAYEIALDDANAYIMLDDETDEMISICAYHEHSNKQFLAGYKSKLCDETLEIIKKSKKDILFVKFIAGLGRNAAYSTMKDIMQIAKNEGRIVLLQPLSSAWSFYEKLGFSDLQLYGQCGAGSGTYLEWGLR